MTVSGFQADLKGTMADLVAEKMNNNLEFCLPKVARSINEVNKLILQIEKMKFKN